MYTQPLRPLSATVSAIEQEKVASEPKKKKTFWRMPNCFACFALADRVEDLPIKDKRNHTDRSTRYDSSIWALNSTTHAASSIGTTTSDFNDDTWILNGRFEVAGLIGQGSFGSVYKGIDLESDEHVAIKIERKTKKHSTSFDREIKFLKELSSLPCVPKLFWHGVDDADCDHDDNANLKSNTDKRTGKPERTIVVLSRLGFDLSVLFDYCKRSFSLSTVCELGKQMFGLLKCLHEHGVLHRDVKPHNFVLGYQRSDRQKVFVIDFGLSKYYKTGNEHMTYRDGLVPIGTARYASIHTHNGVAQSRRDDMESAVYILIYFLRGSLPWQGLPAENRERKWGNIGLSKQKTTPKVLCKNIPTQFATLLKYTRALKYSEKPNYVWMMNQLDDVVEANRLQRVGDEKFSFDWE